MSKKIFRVGFIAASLTATLFLNGCGALLDPLRMRDDHTPAYRATMIARPDDMEYSHGKGGRGGAEFAYEHYRGEGTQDIAINHFLNLDQGRINGPQRANTSAIVEHGHIAYNHLFPFSSHFELEPAVGLSFDKFSATAQGTAPGSNKFSLSGDKFGVIASLTPRWNFNRFFGAEVRLSASGDLKNTEITSSTFSLVLSPSSHLKLKAGAYRTDHRFETPDTVSNVETGFSGFMGNLTFIF